MNTEKSFNSKRSFRPNSVSFFKSFTNFEDGFSEMIKLNPELKNYCGDSPVYENVISKILDILKMDIPTINNSSYPNTLSASIDANEVGFKTDANIAFGWRTGFNFKEGIQYFNFRISYISLPSYKKSIFSTMEEAGWEKMEKERQSRFWNKTENRDSFRRKKYHNSENNTKEETTTNGGFSNPIEEKLSESSDVTNEIQGTVQLEEETVETEQAVEEAVVEQEVQEESGTVYPEGYPMTKEEAIESFIHSSNYVEGEPVDFTWQDPKDDSEVLIKYEEIMAYKMHNDNAINKTALPTKFIVTHRGSSSMIDLNDPNTYTSIGASVDGDYIKFTDGVSYNYNTLEVITD